MERVYSNGHRITRRDLRHGLYIYSVIVLLAGLFIGAGAMKLRESNNKINIDLNEEVPAGYEYCGKFYTVEYGESFWSIASDLKKEFPAMAQLDTRAIQNYMIEINNLGISLEAGDCIIIPAWVSPEQITDESGLRPHLVEYVRNEDY